LKPEYLIETPSKLNLGLRILEQRADGFHNIQSVFQTVDLCDRILVGKLTAKNKDQLQVNGPVEVPADSSNLVLKTLKALRREGIELPPLEIKLEKKVPTGGGLGGGSANAAGIIHLAARINPELDLYSEKILNMAADLGADVPFFLYGGTMLVRGIGELLTPLPEQRGLALIAVPDYNISTVYAYENFKGYLGDSSPCFEPRFPESAPEFWKKMDLKNDFEPLLAATRPLHVKIRDALEEWTEWNGLTGSGSALYGLFERKEKMAEACDELEEAFPAVDFYRTKFLSAADCMSIKKSEV
jgi:4-diphosphocytidyl-2-C-methyl-D-erythritol kinase